MFAIFFKKYCFCLLNFDLSIFINNFIIIVIYIDNFLIININKKFINIVKRIFVN